MDKKNKTFILIDWKNENYHTFCQSQNDNSSHLNIMMKLRNKVAKLSSNDQGSEFVSPINKVLNELS